MTKSFYLGLVIGFALVVVREMLTLLTRQKAAEDYRKMIANGVERIASALEGLERKE